MKFVAFNKDFFERDPKIVAIELLGNFLVRRIKNRLLISKIVETEAYYGYNDPASRAYKGIKKYNRAMVMEPGIAFIYMVHSNWLLNVVAHPKNDIGAILIRAVEPLNFKSNTRGPGRITRALKIDKRFNEKSLLNLNSSLFLALNVNKGEFEIASSKRIGLKRDLEENLRFFIKGNPFVSR
jgi:DNA-3-methyladenine glycosylase (3mg)